MPPATAAADTADAAADTTARDTFTKEKLGVTDKLGVLESDIIVEVSEGDAPEDREPLPEREADAEAEEERESDAVNETLPEDEGLNEVLGVVVAVPVGVQPLERVQPVPDADWMGVSEGNDGSAVIAIVGYCVGSAEADEDGVAPKDSDADAVIEGELVGQAPGTGAGSVSLEGVPMG